MPLGWVAVGAGGLIAQVFGVSLLATGSTDSVAPWATLGGSGAAVLALAFIAKKMAAGELVPLAVKQLIDTLAADRVEAEKRHAVEKAELIRQHEEERAERRREAEATLEALRTQNALVADFGRRSTDRARRNIDQKDPA